MPDREKYIEILSKAVKTVKEFNEDTPIKISLECVEDILELLKEQDYRGWLTDMFHKYGRDDLIALLVLHGEENLLADVLKEQEAKNGEWITIWQEDDPDTSTHAKCSVCNRISERPLGRYCKWCGAEMNQELDRRRSE